MVRKLHMPEDGWDNREVTFHCELCDKTLKFESIYLNLDWLISEGITQAEFGLELHLNDEHTYDEDTKTWSK